MTNSNFRVALLAASSLLAVAMPGHAFAAEAAGAATAATATDAGDQSTSANQAGQANDRQSLTSSDIIVIGSQAAQVAPITASLTTTQPQAAVSRAYIENSVAASADFNQLIAITPGVSITGTGNGVGFSESKAVIRGFQDGEYNVTYDSIPFADTNNPTHHSTAFFPSNAIETVVVDRGPGNASQLGQATFGGNVNMYSRAVKDEMGGQVEGILGNWNTFIGRAEFQSGKIAKLNDAQLVLTGQFLRSDGALTFSPVNSKNVFAKLVVPIGSSTLTIMSTYNRNFYYQSDSAKGAVCGRAVDASGAALTQLTGENCTATSDIGIYGKNFGLTANPKLPSYYLYNRTDKTTDFSYIRLQSTLAQGLSMDNRVYMYAYTNNTFSGNTGTVVTGFNTSKTPITTITAPGDVLGYDKGNKYRTIGYIGQINYEFSMGKVRVGGWYEHASTDRRRLDLDMTTGGISYNEKFNNGTASTSTLPSIALANVNYLQHSGWNQYQLFAEFEFRPVETLSITPGVKYVHFTRSIDALVNQDSLRSPIKSEGTWTKTLPFATINWAVTPSFATYAQYAQGMYVPDLSSFYTPFVSASDQATQASSLAKLAPQTTTNYQIGGVWHGQKVSIDADAYLIDVNNKIASDPTIGTVGGAPSGTLVNIGRVRYKGVEGQVSYMPITGLTLFVNGSYNEAKNRANNAQISKTPFYTAALGAFYSRDGFRVSFTQKFTGASYASEYSGLVGERLYRIAAYSMGDFAISQDIGRNFRIGMTVNNVFNSRAISSISTSSTGATKNAAGLQTGYGTSDEFSFLPPRSALVSVRVKF